MRTIALLLTTIGISAAAMASVPRYSIPVGTKLTYETLAQDGSRQALWHVWIGKGREKSTSRALIFRERKGMTSLGYLDFSADGKVSGSQGLDFMLNPVLLFPELPADEAGLESGWVTYDAFEENDVKNSVVSDDSERLAFRAVRASVLDKVYGFTSTYTYLFDRKAGRVAETATEFTHGDKKDTTSTKLVGEATLSEEALKSISGEADLYFEGARNYVALLKLAEADLATTKKFLEEAKTVLTELRKHLTFKEGIAAVEEKIASHDLIAQFTLQAVGAKAEFVGKPAPDWEATDFSGKTHRLADYRGKVVLLDFWYKGCGWCIRSIPALKKLAEEFSGKAFALLGMNVDRKEEDALFVIDVLGVKYPNLKAQAIADQYKVLGYPTMFLLDTEGKVSTIQLGYSTQMKKELAEKIQALLPER